MADSNSLERVHDPGGGLLESPPRLGLLPTKWFWFGRVPLKFRAAIAVAFAPPMYLLFHAIYSSALHPVAMAGLALLGATGGPSLVLGLVERGVRRELKRRRRQTAAIAASLREPP